MPARDVDGDTFVHKTVNADTNARAAVAMIAIMAAAVSPAASTRLN